MESQKGAKLQRPLHAILSERCLLFMLYAYTLTISELPRQRLAPIKTHPKTSGTKSTIVRRGNPVLFPRINQNTSFLL